MLEQKNTLTFTQYFFIAVVILLLGISVFFVIQNKGFKRSSESTSLFVKPNENTIDTIIADTKGVRREGEVENGATASTAYLVYGGTSIDLVTNMSASLEAQGWNIVSVTQTTQNLGPHKGYILVASEPDMNETLQAVVITTNDMHSVTLSYPSSVSKK